MDLSLHGASQKVISVVIGKVFSKDGIWLIESKPSTEYDSRLWGVLEFSL